MGAARRYDLVIDVRSKLEFLFGHLPDAVCYPHAHVVERLGERKDVGPSTRILVYCASGARSAAATTSLRAAGYRNIVDGGGMAAARGYLEA